MTIIHGMVIGGKSDGKNRHASERKFTVIA